MTQDQLSAMTPSEAAQAISAGPVTVTYRCGNTETCSTLQQLLAARWRCQLAMMPY